jgi:hypothetical protein
VPPRYDAAPHRTIVADVHDALLHATASSSDVVAVGSFELKFSPEIVTETPALSAMLDGKTFVTCWASAPEERSAIVKTAVRPAGTHRCPCDAHGFSLRPSRTALKSPQNAV